MTKYSVIAVIAVFTFSACMPKSPHRLSQEVPEFVHIGKSDNFPMLVECIFKKVEKFPAVKQMFEFEDKTLPVHISQFSDNAEMYQRIQMYTLSLIKLRKTSGNQVEVKLYVGDSVYGSNVAENYPKLIEGCFK